MRLHKDRKQRISYYFKAGLKPSDSSYVRSMWLSCRAVSYTHLDVYKRQQLTATLLKQLSGYEIKKIFHALSYFSTELENVSVQAVSYTHLDLTTRILRKMEEENKKEKEGASFSMQVKEELSYVEGTSRHCKPVSYTHLDVYKRQGSS